jgi:hypothetical protein
MESKIWFQVSFLYTFLESIPKFRRGSGLVCANWNWNYSKPPNWVPAQHWWQHDKPNIYPSGWMRGAGGLSLFVIPWYSLLPLKFWQDSKWKISKLKWFFYVLYQCFFFPPTIFVCFIWQNLGNSWIFF